LLCDRSLGLFRGFYILKQKMSVKQVLQIESEIATEQSVTIPFEFKNTDKLPNGKNTGDSIVIKPITIRTWFRIKPLLMLIDKKDREKIADTKDQGFNDDTAELMSKYDIIIFKIVCLGIHNRKGDMPDWFREVLKDNCTWEDIYILFNAILYRLGCNPFSRTITALEAVSPLSEDEMIALQKNDETWEKKKMDRKATSCS